MEVSKLGFICLSVMVLGLNGCNPVAAKAALMVSGVKAQRHTWQKTPAKSSLLLYTEFLIEYYEYSFNYLITITNQFTINAHT